VELFLRREMWKRDIVSASKMGVVRGFLYAYEKDREGTEGIGWVVDAQTGEAELSD
jgi:hypothetical protein